jgi:hypothetical protein
VSNRAIAKEGATPTFNEEFVMTFRGTYAVVAFVALAMPAAGCGSKSSNVAAPTADSASVSALSVAPDPVAVPKGGSKQLRATATLGDGSKKDVSSDSHWSSDNPQLATVDDKGMVVGAGVGVTKIRAEYGGASGTSTVTVTP